MSQENSSVDLSVWFYVVFIILIVACGVAGCWGAR